MRGGGGHGRTEKEKGLLLSLEKPLQPVIRVAGWLCVWFGAGAGCDGRC